MFLNGKVSDGEVPEEVPEPCNVNNITGREAISGKSFVKHENTEAISGSGARKTRGRRAKTEEEQPERHAKRIVYFSARRGGTGATQKRIVYFSAFDLSCAVCRWYCLIYRVWAGLPWPLSHFSSTISSQISSSPHPSSDHSHLRFTFYFGRVVVRKTWCARQQKHTLLLHMQQHRCSLLPSLSPNSTFFPFSGELLVEF